MDGGEDQEENKAPENGEAPGEDSTPPEPPKEPTPDPTPKSPTPALNTPSAKSPTPEFFTPQKTPSRSITPPLKTNSNLSKPVSEKIPSKSASSGVKISDIIDESQERISEQKMILQQSGALKSGASGTTTAAYPLALGDYGSGGLFKKRSPFIHDPPQPEERRARFSHPRTPREYIINLREDLADFQETHGLPRTRDYSFLSLGLALAQETARAVCSVLLMFAELFPILAIVSLILRFALDKLIEILETAELVPKLKKSVIFVAEMIVIVIPLWILIGSIVIPLISLIFSMFAKMLRMKKGKKTCPLKSPQVKAAPMKEAKLPCFLFLRILCVLEKLYHRL